MGQTPQLLIRRLTKEDLPAYIELHKAIFNSDTNVDHWMWKYFNNPAGEHHIFIAEKDGQIVGQVGAIPLKFRIDGQPVVALQHVDIAVLKEHRAGGTFNQLEKAARESAREAGISFSFGFGNELTSKISRKMLSFKNVATVQNMLRIYDFRHFLTNKTKRNLISQLLGPVLSILFRAFNAIRPFDPAIRFRSIERFDENFSELYRNAITQPISAERNAEYLNWRYFDVPSIKYTVLAAYKKDKLMGYCVIKVSNNKPEHGQICELVIDAPGFLNTSAFIRKIDTYFRSKGVRYVNACWVPPHTKIFPLLKLCGCLPRKIKFYLNVRGEADSAIDQRLVKTEDWHYSLGDSDFFMD